MLKLAKKTSFSWLTYERMYKISTGFIALFLKPVLKASRKSVIIKNAIFNSAVSDYLIAEGNETFVVSSGDQIIGRSLYTHNEFEFSLVGKAFELAGLKTQNDDLLFIDVGANVGSTCIPVVKRKLAGRAIAIEPEPLNSRLLKANIILNQLEAKIDVFTIALGDKEDENLLLELSSNNFGDHRIRAQNFNDDDTFCREQRKTVDVKSTTLDALLKIKEADNAVLWLDTQGYEGFIPGQSHFNSSQ